jgi:hypothetical protein
MLICIDGTGTDSGTLGDLRYGTHNRAANYAQDMVGSFVWTIYFGSHQQNRKYYEGPGVLGTGPNMIHPSDVCQRISEFWRQGDRQIFMTGYSRGAAICINVAAMLNDESNKMPDGQRAQVQAMFLFDAVSRSVELPFSQTIPSNVRYCYHAMRDDQANSRRTFGHCGVAANPGFGLKEVTYLVTRKFYTTHGGMGGVPWGEDGVPGMNKQAQAFARQVFSPAEQACRFSMERIEEGGLDGATNVTVAQEKAGSQQVHDWMWPFLRKHGVV